MFDNIDLEKIASRPVAVAFVLSRNRATELLEGATRAEENIDHLLGIQIERSEYMPDDMYAVRHSDGSISIHRYNDDV